MSCIATAQPPAYCACPHNKQDTAQTPAPPEWASQKISLLHQQTLPCNATSSPKTAPITNHPSTLWISTSFCCHLHCSHGNLIYGRGICPCKQHFPPWVSTAPAGRYLQGLQALQSPPQLHYHLFNESCHMPVPFTLPWKQIKKYSTHPLLWAKASNSPVLPNTGLSLARAASLSELLLPQPPHS